MYTTFLFSETSSGHPSNCFEYSFLLSIGLGIFLIIFSLSTIALTVTVIVLIKEKSKLQKELETTKEQKASVIYDEVKPLNNTSSKCYIVQENSAYGCAKKMCT